MRSVSSLGILMLALLIDGASCSRLFAPRGGAMVQKLQRAVDAIKFPNKDKLSSYVRRLGKKHQKKFPGYKFAFRGGLSSPLIEHVSDIDFIFGDKVAGLVDLEDFDALVGLVTELTGGLDNVMSAKVEVMGEALFDAKIQGEDLQPLLRPRIAEGADLVVITGLMTLKDDWRIPIDCALMRGTPSPSKSDRIEKMLNNFKEGNYAKAVQRGRGLLTSQGKRKLADAWNRRGGGLRFLESHLRRLPLLPPSVAETYFTEKLHLTSPPSPEEWADVAWEEMQRQALLVLRDSNLPFRNKFAAHSKRALEAWEEVLEAAEQAAESAEPESIS